MSKQSLYLALVTVLLMSLCITIVPVNAWSYPDGTEDKKFEKFGPRLDRLFIKLYSTDIAEFTAMEGGEIDMVEWPLPEEYIEKWTTQSPYKENIKVESYGAELGMFIIDINCLKTYAGDYERGVQGEPNPTSVPCLRHALWHLMDRAYICANIWGGYGVPMYTPVPPSMGEYVHPDIVPGGALEVLTHPFNCTYAAEILDDCGVFPIGDDGWRFWDLDGDGEEDPDEGMGPGEKQELWFYIRSEHALRRELGLWFAGMIETCLKISVKEQLKDFYGCWQPVMLEHEFNLYTGGWSLGPEPDHLVLYQSYYYWYPGFCYNYGGMNCSTYDYWVDELLFAATFPDAKYATWMAQEAFNDPHIEEDGHTPLCTCEYGSMGSIPVVCSAGYKAYWRRYTGGTGCTPVTPDDGENKYRGNNWTHAVNMPAYGCDSFFSFINMYPEGHEYGDCENMTLRWGFKVDKLVKYGNPVYAEWMWDWNVMGLIYESLLIRNPYTFDWMPWLVKDFETGVWTDPLTGEEKSKVVFRLREDVFWQDGKPLTAADVFWTMIEMPKALEDAGLPPPWWQSNVAYIQSMYLYDAYNIEILLSVKSVWAVGWIGGCIILPKHIWKPLIEAHVAGLVDLTGPAPEHEYFGTYTGTGPYLFTDYVEGSHVLLTAWKPEAGTIPGETSHYFRYALPLEFHWQVVDPPELAGRTKLPYNETVTYANDIVSLAHESTVINSTIVVTDADTAELLFGHEVIDFEIPPQAVIRFWDLHITATLLDWGYSYWHVEKAWDPPGWDIIHYHKEKYYHVSGYFAVTLGGEIIFEAYISCIWIKVEMDFRFRVPHIVPNPDVCDIVGWDFELSWHTIKEDIVGSTWYDQAAYVDPDTGEIIHPFTDYPYKDQLPTPDLKVRVDDVLYAALAFGSQPGHSRWAPIADINGDYKVRVDDILAIALQFGWTG